MSERQHATLFAHALDGNGPALEEALRQSGFEGARFLEFAGRHAVAAHFHALLEEGGWLGLLPGSLAHGLGAIRERRRRTADRLIDEAGRLRRRLEAFDVDATYLKGPFLSSRFYGDPRRRAYGDLDLLVRGGSDLDVSHRALRAEGYRRLSWRLPELARRFVYHYTYEGERAKVDLHWSLRSHFSYRIDYGRLWATRETERLGGLAFPVLSPEYELLLLSLSIVGDYQKGRVRLKFLTDVYLVLTALGDATDWTAFFERRRDEGVLRPTVAVLDLTLRILDRWNRFPTLAGYCAGLAWRGDCYGLGDASRFLEWSAKLGRRLENHIWTFRLHEGGVARSLAWRALGEPFHRAVFR